MSHQYTLGKRLRTIRRFRKITLASLSTATGLSVSFLSDVELGKRSPSLNSLITLAKALEINIEALVKGLDK